MKIIHLLFIITIFTYFNCEEDPDVRPAAESSSAGLDETAQSKVENECTVFHYIDGDTVSLICEEKEVHIRLIGIDTPESSANSKAKEDAAEQGVSVDFIVDQGKQSAAFTKSLTPIDSVVTLEYDVDILDYYGRTLAYIYLKDGRMLNDIIVSSGYAYTMNIKPNVKYADKLSTSYLYAKNNKLGLWR